MSACVVLIGCASFERKPNPILVEIRHVPNVELEYRVTLPGSPFYVEEEDALESARSSAQSKCKEMGAGSAHLLSERTLEHLSHHRYHLKFTCVKDE